MGDGTEFIASEVGLFKCPKCGEEMIELIQDIQGMSDGQLADYEMGFNRPFQCSGCSYYQLLDVGVPGIDFDSFEVEPLEERRHTPLTIEESAENAERVGIILIEAIEIEFLIEDVILRYYFSGEGKKTEFHEDILKKEFFSFEQKIKLLKKIRDCGEDGLIKEIRKVQAIRNTVAHNQGIFDERTRNYIISHREGGKKKSEAFNKKYIQKFQHDCFTIKEKLKGIKEP